ncbi:class I SAM-dependent methyltransferase [Duganella radicis]|uniref:Methyltransferase domain-containing protein n=1 Tax=Duganella radicis TaxID=551988 RepID=A0A6L6PST7_9BURK|nr:class I SAM-dependent methyltransferase [Duganella radicis]MTV41737.1 methyltransferase domain-containing protein [Duganella radicis]
MSWNNGYVADIAYPAGFFPELSPAHLSLACLLNGYQPVALDAPFTYCELGCGRGLTANALAASNPHGRFYACDFNPAHVAEARELAAAAGLDNLTVLENSFAELAGGAVALPQFDFVTMRGVYGWINDENRAHIAAFLARYVKPGGVVHVNYNTMPGWAAAQPLQRLVLEVADAAVGTRTQRCEQARQVIGQLVALEARYFTEHSGDGMRQRLESIRADGADYLAHEYMNHGWRPLYHADVADQLAGAGLAYVGAADLTRALPGLYLTPPQRQQYARTPPALRATVADYLANTSFRDDVYVRGATPLSPALRGAWLERIGLALTVPRGLARHKITLASGQLVDDAALYQPVLDALAAGPRSLAALAALPALRQRDPADLYQVAALLVSSGQASGYAVGADADAGPARRLNRAMAAAPHEHSSNRVLASAVLGGGILTSATAQLVYRALCDGEEAPAARVLDWAREEGHAAAEPAELTAKIQRILEQLVPLWRQLKVL